MSAPAVSDASNGAGNGADYYATGNYRTYLERGARYERTARELDEFLDRVCLRLHADPVLDFGCGPGLMVRALERVGFRNVYGYDPSEWAVRFARQQLGIPGVTCDFESAMSRRYALALALDSLEHSDDPAAALRRLRARSLVVRVPVSHTDGGAYVLASAESDETHRVRLTHDGWRALLSGAGWAQVVRLNLATLYDSDGVHVAMYRPA